MRAFPGDASDAALDAGWVVVRRLASQPSGWCCKACADRRSAPRRMTGKGRAPAGLAGFAYIALDAAARPGVEMAHNLGMGGRWYPRVGPGLEVARLGDE